MAAGSAGKRIMTRQEVLDYIREIGIVPVIRAETPEAAVLAAKAAAKGGITVAEITMTVPNAIDAIREVVRAIPNLLVGAGTVLDVETAANCLEAGAQFIVSPGFDAETVAWAVRRGVPMVAGALTPTEVITAYRAGSDVVKIFPCGDVGGPRYLKSLKAALPQIPMMPTGGVNLTTVGPFLQAGAFALGAGSELISKDAMAKGDYAAITESARQFVAAVKAARGQQ